MGERVMSMREARENLWHTLMATRAVKTMKAMQETFICRFGVNDAGIPIEVTAPDSAQLGG